MCIRDRRDPHLRVADVGGSGGVWRWVATNIGSPLQHLLTVEVSMSRSYLPRLVDDQLTRGLRSAGAVVLEGPKACGKTTTAGEQAASVVRLDTSPQLRAAALADPSVLLAGETPHLIDEWQMVPDVWNAVRHAVDDRQASGQFILTGSATPTEDVTRHTGAGRFARIRMMPMSLFEQKQSSGTVSLDSLFNGDPSSNAGPEMDLTGVAELLCRGGWPGNVKRDLSDVLNANRDYLATIAGADIVTLDGIRRDPRKVTALIFTLARNAGTYVTNRTLQADITREGVMSAWRVRFVTYVPALRARVKIKAVTLRGSRRMPSRVTMSAPAIVAR